MKRAFDDINMLKLRTVMIIPTTLFHDTHANERRSTRFSPTCQLKARLIHFALTGKKDGELCRTQNF